MNNFLGQLINANDFEIDERTMSRLRNWGIENCIEIKKTGRLLQEHVGLYILSMTVRNTNYANFKLNFETIHIICNELIVDYST